MSSPLRSPIRRHQPLPLLLRVTAAWVGLAWLSGPLFAAPPAALAGGGVATVPHDAAFFRSSLRLKEQFDRFLASNAFAALRDLPAIERAIDSWEEQREMPGSMGSMILAFLDLPENAEAAELLSDMVATDTFVYGEPSCTSFMRLLVKLQRAQRAAALRKDQATQRAAPAEEEMEEDAAVPGDAQIVPVRQVLEFDVGEPAQAAVFLETLAANLDLIVVPDVVWGFQTTKAKAGASQLTRLETLAKLLVEMNPALAGSLDRKQVAGGQVVTFTLDGSLLPWERLTDELVAELGESEDLDRVLARVRKLNIVLAVGMIGDWVVISVGDSIDHLDKLVIDAGGRSLIDTPAFKPLLEHATEKLTAIAYVSEPLAEPLAEAVSSAGGYFDAAIAMVDQVAQENDLPAAAGREARELLERAAAEHAKRRPEPGAWIGYSFLSATGYEGYEWDFSSRQPLDGSARLDLLRHAGGDPLAAVAWRLKGDPDLLDAAAGLAGDAWKWVVKYARPRMQEDDGERFDAFNKRIAPLGGRLATIVRDKLVAALADGQLGLVLDAKSTSTKPQAGLPSSAEPLPLIEPAIVLPLKDRKLFVEGLDDLFALGDELVAEIRDLEPDAIPADYEIPAPEPQQVDQGMVWSFQLAEAGLDEQVRPSVGVGDDVAVLTLVPRQAARLLAAKPLETASRITRFEEPLARAAALDFAGLVDALEPWLVYMTRYGCVQQQEGRVEPEAKLSEDDETVEAAEALEQVRVVLDVARCLEQAAAETFVRDGSLVTRWRNVIRDLPAR